MNENLPHILNTYTQQNFIRPTKQNRFIMLFVKLNEIGKDLLANLGCLYSLPIYFFSRCITKTSIKFPSNLTPKYVRSTHDSIFFCVAVFCQFTKICFKNCWQVVVWHGLALSKQPHRCISGLKCIFEASNSKIACFWFRFELIAIKTTAWPHSEQRKATEITTRINWITFTLYAYVVPIRTFAGENRLKFVINEGKLPSYSAYYDHSKIYVLKMLKQISERSKCLNLRVHAHIIFWCFD